MQDIQENPRDTHLNTIGVPHASSQKNGPCFLGFRRGAMCEQGIWGGLLGSTLFHDLKVEFSCQNSSIYRLVISYGYWKLPFIVDLRIKHGDFPQLCEFTRGYHLLSFRDISHGLQSSASYPSLISELGTTWPSGKYLTYYLLLISWYIWIILYCCYIMLYIVYTPTTWILWCISRYTLWVWVPKLFAKTSLS